MIAAMDIIIGIVALVIMFGVLLVWASHDELQGRVHRSEPFARSPRH
jgi:hypothetical protein